MLSPSILNDRARLHWISRQDCAVSPGCSLSDYSSRPKMTIVPEPSLIRRLAYQPDFIPLNN
jgi:hypothetical protein